MPPSAVKLLAAVKAVQAGRQPNMQASEHACYSGALCSLGCAAWVWQLASVWVQRLRRTWATLLVTQNPLGVTPVSGHAGHQGSVGAAVDPTTSCCVCVCACSQVLCEAAVTPAGAEDGAANSGSGDTQARTVDSASDSCCQHALGCQPVSAGNPWTKM